MERPHPSADVGGFVRLALDATLGITRIVEALHHTIQQGPAPFGAMPEGRTRGVTGLVYKSITGATSLAGVGLDALLAQLVPRLGKSQSSVEREAVVAALNGVLGDHLEHTTNPLSLTMSFRAEDGTLAFDPLTRTLHLDAPTSKVLVLLHGLCMNDLQWTREGHNHGTALARELGYTPVYLRYNTGRHISTNGREFAQRLEQLLNAWPQPVAHLTILGHSMGGLVARSAHHYGERLGYTWPARLNDLVFLGSPHHGSHIERGGHRLQSTVALSPYGAPLSRLGRLRSAGVTDLRHGNLLDEDWEGMDRFERDDDLRRPLPLPEGVRCYTVAASLQRPLDTRKLRAGTDGLVPVHSALGEHRDPARALAFSPARRRIFGGRSHFDLLSDAEVYGALKGWLET